MNVGSVGDAEDGAEGTALELVAEDGGLDREPAVAKGSWRSVGGWIPCKGSSKDRSGRGLKSEGGGGGGFDADDEATDDLRGRSVCSADDPCGLLIEGDEGPARGGGSLPPLLSLLSSDGIAHGGKRVPGGAVEISGEEKEWFDTDGGAVQQSSSIQDRRWMDYGLDKCTPSLPLRC